MQYTKLFAKAISAFILLISVNANAGLIKVDFSADTRDGLVAGDFTFDDSTL